MENGQPEEAGHAHGCLRCYRWVLPRATPREEIPLQEMAPPAEQAAQQEVAPVAAENPQPRIAPQQPINQAEAANMENPRQPEEAESDHEECCCACFYPPSIPREEIPLFPLGQEPAQQAVVPVAAVNLQPMSGPQQPLNQAVEGIGEADMGLECTECPKENYTFYIVFSFTLLFLLFLGQALNILSYELGWRGNGTENASMQTNSNATTESNMIFDITTAITI